MNCGEEQGKGNELQRTAMDMNRIEPFRNGFVRISLDGQRICAEK